MRTRGLLSCKKPSLAPRAAWADPSFWLYTAALAPDPTTDASALAARRDAILDALAVDGIEGRPIWTPLHRTQLYGSAPRLGGAVADDLFARGFSLPSSSSLSEADQDRVISALRRAVGASARSAAGIG